MIARSRLTAITSALLPNWLPLKNKATQNESEPKNQFQRVFSGRQRVILPVIHVISLKQAVENAKIAFDANADGIFLINHAILSNELLAIHARMVDMMPDQWVGINCLGWSPIEVVQAAPVNIKGIWVDDAQIDERRLLQPDAERVEILRQSRIPQCLFFGGVAFKYQRDVVDVETASRIAKNYMDVVTTSGPGTGCAAPIDKIRRMRQALND